MSGKNKVRKIIIWSAVSLVLLMILVLISVQLYINGYIQFNDPLKEEYSVWGVDVSSYQGDIDWIRLSAGMDFAYIKATEGSTSVDSKFVYNYSQAQKTVPRVGAYHFFSYDSSGKTQAENFISQVQAYQNMLPPVIDLEFYGDKEQNPPAREDVEKELNVMLDELEKHYNMKPVIYATGKSYNMYLAGGYQEYDIWIRDVVSKPNLSDGRNWTFWQYSEKGQLQGYSGDERFIDLNVFWGTEEEFSKYK